LFGFAKDLSFLRIAASKPLRSYLRKMYGVEVNTRMKTFTEISTSDVYLSQSFDF